MQTSLTFLNSLIEKNNNLSQIELKSKKQIQIQGINDIIERLISSLKIKQQDLIE